MVVGVRDCSLTQHWLLWRDNSLTPTAEFSGTSPLSATLLLLLHLLQLSNVTCLFCKSLKENCVYILPTFGSN